MCYLRRPIYRAKHTEGGGGAVKRLPRVPFIIGNVRMGLFIRLVETITAPLIRHGIYMNVNGGHMCTVLMRLKILLIVGQDYVKTDYWLYH